MKTPMQKLIDKLDFVIQMWKEPSNEMDGLHTLNELKKEAESLLPEERQIVIDAYIQCWMDDGGNGTTMIKPAEQYYNETYGSNDKE